MSDFFTWALWKADHTLKDLSILQLNATTSRQEKCGRKKRLFEKKVEFLRAWRYTAPHSKQVPRSLLAE
jgi:hypothetical protein